MLCISCHFIPLKPLTLWMDHAKLLDVLTSLPISHVILPCLCPFFNVTSGRLCNSSYISKFVYGLKEEDIWETCYSNKNCVDFIPVIQDVIGRDV